MSLRILVTGTGAPMGRAVVRELERRGHTVAALRRAGAPQPSAGPTFVADGDAAALRRFAPHVGIHLAWAHTSDRTARDDSRHLDENYALTMRIVRELHAAGARYFLGMGSHEEYGPSPRAFTPASPARPQTAYGVAKYVTGLASAKLCESLGMGHGWLRLTAAYGPIEERRYLIASLLEKLARREPAPMTAGAQRRDFLYVDDLAEGVALAAESFLAGFFPFGSGKATSLRRVAKILSGFFPESPAPVLGALPYREGESLFQRCEVRPLEQAIGWRPRVTIEEGLRRTAVWYRERIA